VLIGVCTENQKMKITNSSCVSTVFKLLVVAALPAQVSGAYKILAIPFPAKSHVFGMSAVVVGLADRGHEVTFFVGETLRLNVPELRNRPEISVVRYRDTVDYDAAVESIVKEMIETGGDTTRLIASASTRYEDLNARNTTPKANLA